jgi:hypothetical protein
VLTGPARNLHEAIQRGQAQAGHTLCWTAKSLPPTAAGQDLARGQDDRCLVLRKPTIPAAISRPRDAAELATPSKHAHHITIWSNMCPKVLWHSACVNISIASDRSRVNLQCRVGSVHDLIATLRARRTLRHSHQDCPPSPTQGRKAQTRGGIP